MNHAQLLSRRPVADKVDFRIDLDPESPYAQLRRLEVYLDERNVGPDDLSDCPEALNYWREYQYRKLFTGTTHEEFIALDESDPKAIDWLCAIHEIVAERFQQRRK
jgi:hypothetical protein